MAVLQVTSVASKRFQVTWQDGVSVASCCSCAWRSQQKPITQRENMGKLHPKYNDAYIIMKYYRIHTMHVYTCNCPGLEHLTWRGSNFRVRYSQPETSELRPSASDVLWSSCLHMHCLIKWRCNWLDISDNIWISCQTHGGFWCVDTAKRGYLACEYLGNLALTRHVKSQEPWSHLAQEAR
jgi:hypothetical protein